MEYIDLRVTDGAHPPDRLCGGAVRPGLALFGLAGVKTEQPETGAGYDYRDRLDSKPDQLGLRTSRRCDHGPLYREALGEHRLRNPRLGRLRGIYRVGERALLLHRLGSLYTRQFGEHNGAGDGPGSGVWADDLHLVEHSSSNHHHRTLDPAVLVDDAEGTGADAQGGSQPSGAGR